MIGKKTTTFEILGRRHPRNGALRTKTSFHFPTFGFLQTRLVPNERFGLAAGAIVTFGLLHWASTNGELCDKLCALS
jgi:hypothetical protein